MADRFSLPKLLARGSLTNDSTSSMYIVPGNFPGSSRPNVKATISSMIFQSRRGKDPIKAETPAIGTEAGSTNINVYARDISENLVRILPQALIIDPSASFRFEPGLAQGTESTEGAMVFNSGEGLFADCQHGEQLDYAIFGTEESAAPGKYTGVLAAGSGPTAGLANFPDAASTLYTVPTSIPGQVRKINTRINLIIITENTRASSAAIGANQFVIFLAKAADDDGKPVFVTPLQAIPDSGLALITSELLMGPGDKIKMMAEDNADMGFIIFGTETLRG
tara:strand:+ start:1024 stop:1863 length:840 start_codon:yes stop_codon:yes gene_type:complete